MGNVAENGTVRAKRRGLQLPFSGLPLPLSPHQGSWSPALCSARRWQTQAAFSFIFRDTGHCISGGQETSISSGAESPPRGSLLGDPELQQSRAATPAQREIRAPADGAASLPRDSGCPPPQPLPRALVGPPPLLPFPLPAEPPRVPCSGADPGNLHTPCVFSMACTHPRPLHALSSATPSLQPRCLP